MYPPYERTWSTPPPRTPPPPPPLPPWTIQDSLHYHHCHQQDQYHNSISTTNRISTINIIRTINSISTINSFITTNSISTINSIRTTNSMSTINSISTINNCFCLRQSSFYINNILCYYSITKTPFLYTVHIHESLQPFGHEQTKKRTVRYFGKPLHEINIHEVK